MTTAYPQTPHDRAHRPPRRSDYHAYRRCLRLEFEYTCVYCRSGEAFIAPVSPHGDFHIDHFEPESRSNRSDYDNLLWACPQCNLAKRAAWPDVAELARGFRYLNPCTDAMADHLRVVADVVVALTPAGEYTLEQIELNSPTHLERRQARTRFLRILAAVEARLATQTPGPAVEHDREEAAWLRRALGQIPPWDPVASCLCATTN